MRHQDSDLIIMNTIISYIILFNNNKVNPYLLDLKQVHKMKKNKIFMSYNNKMINKKHLIQQSN
jgi:hypothetical protein